MPNPHRVKIAQARLRDNWNQVVHWYWYDNSVVVAYISETVHGLDGVKYQTTELPSFIMWAEHICYPPIFFEAAHQMYHEGVQFGSLRDAYKKYEIK